MVLLQYATCAGVQKCADIHHPYAGIVLHLVTGGKLSGWQCAVLGNSGTLVVLVTFTTKKTKSENNWPCIYKCFATDGTLKSPTCHINTVIPYLIHWASYDKLSVHLATITCTIAILYSALPVCCKLYSLWEISLHTAWVNVLQQVTIKGIAYISSTCCQSCTHTYTCTNNILTVHHCLHLLWHAHLYTQLTKLLVPGSNIPNCTLATIQ